MFSYFHGALRQNDVHVQELCHVKKIQERHWLDRWLTQTDAEKTFWVQLCKFREKNPAVLEIGKQTQHTHKFTFKIASLRALKMFTYINVDKELCNIGISLSSNVFLSYQQWHFFVKQNVFWEISFFHSSYKLHDGQDSFLSCNHGGWINCNMIFRSGYEGAMTCTTVLVDKMQTMKVRIDPHT